MGQKSNMTTKEKIFKTLEKHITHDELEKDQTQDILKWLTSGSEIFRIKKPATPRKHLVSYFVPFDVNKKKLLLTHHKKSNLWLPPGGHVEPNEDPRDTAIREMKEELDAEAQFIFQSPFFVTVSDTVNDLNPHTDVSLWFLVHGDSTKEYNFDPREFYTVKWFDLRNLPEKQEPHLTRFIAKLRNKFKS